MWLENTGCQQKATKTIESALPDFITALATMNLCHSLAFHLTAQRIMQIFKCSPGQSYCNISKTPNEIFATKVDQLKKTSWCTEVTQNKLVENIKDLMPSFHCSMGLRGGGEAIEVVFKEPRHNLKQRFLIILEKLIPNLPVLLF